MAVPLGMAGTTRAISAWVKEDLMETGVLSRLVLSNSLRQEPIALSRIF